MGGRLRYFSQQVPPCVLRPGRLRRLRLCRDLRIRLDEPPCRHWQFVVSEYFRHQHVRHAAFGGLHLVMAMDHVKPPTQASELARHNIDEPLRVRVRTSVDPEGGLQLQGNPPSQCRRVWVGPALLVVPHAVCHRHDHASRIPVCLHQVYVRLVVARRSVGIAVGVEEVAIPA